MWISYYWLAILLTHAKSFLLVREFGDYNHWPLCCFPHPDQGERMWLLWLVICEVSMFGSALPFILYGSKIAPRKHEFPSAPPCANVIWTLICDYLILHSNSGCDLWVNFAQFGGLLRRLIWLSLKATFFPLTLSIFWSPYLLLVLFLKISEANREEKCFSSRVFLKTQCLQHWRVS